MATYIRYSFAVDGTRVAVDDGAQPSGIVSLQSGYTFDYERNIANDPLAKSIERSKFNQIMYLVTDAVRQYQGFGTPGWIPASENGGVDYEYAKYARVVHGGVVYESLVAANTDEPPSANWKIVDQLASTTVANIVKKATLAQLIAAAADVWPDAATLLTGFYTDSYGFDLPDCLGGWEFRVGTTTHNQTEGNFAVTFNRPFTDADSCLYADAISLNASSVVTEDLWFQLVDKDEAGATFYLQGPTTFPTGDRTAFWFAIGKRAV